jgi:hypothetical protein
LLSRAGVCVSSNVGAPAAMQHVRKASISD